MIQKIRKSKVTKIFAVFVLLSFINSLFFTSPLLASSSSLGQPEFGDYKPAEANEMVNLFTGDFSYNIPLLDIDGYPINLFYNDRITMEQEASWVGLGWNINPGALYRNVRGIPDDFNGDNIIRQFKIKNKTKEDINNSGLALRSGFSLPLPLIGIPITPSRGFQAEVGGSKFTDSYLGPGAEIKLGFDRQGSVSFGYEVADFQVASIGVGAGFGLDVVLNSQTGIGINPSVSASLNAGLLVSGGTISRSISVPYNTRQGVKEVVVGKGIGYSVLLFGGQSWSQNSSISLGTQSYTPYIPYDYSYIGSRERNLKGMFVDYTVINYHLYNVRQDQSSIMFTSQDEKNFPSYGYLNFGNVNNPDNSIYDFNREKDDVFTENTKNLPVTNYTYDVYTAMGNGMFSMFRPRRTDFGIVSDVLTSNNGFEIINIKEKAWGGIWLKGETFPLGTATIKGSSGKWKERNYANDLLQFQSKDNGHLLYNPYYFSKAGEKTLYDDNFYLSHYGGDDLIRLKINRKSININLNLPYPLGPINLELKSNDVNIDPLFIGNSDINIWNYDKDLVPQKPRNELFSFLTATEAEDLGLVKDIENYDPYLPTSQGTEIQNPNNVPRISGNRKSHHMSEISVLNENGMRYVYGIPVYNLEKQEVTFNVGDYPSNNGLVQYNVNANVDNSVNNIKGKNNLYSKTQTPAYAEFFLLTAVLSPDYVDLTDNGPTEDDLGNYKKFNYSQKFGESSPFQWRYPIGTDKAVYDEGLKTDDDNYGIYTYGKKEIWYLHSIESKNHIAEFYLSDRDDGLGVLDNNGEVDDTKRLQKLDKIVLYSKQDRYKDINDISYNATPIKTVHFEYDDDSSNKYTLCKGVSNNLNASPDNGKLTLRKVYFTYGKSKKGRLSPYEFDYAYNPVYNRMHVDRWGTYKETENISSTVLPNNEFPYSTQNKTNADQWASAWKLSEIKLPSGSTMNINYESDDYAFVQDKKAMQMINIVGASDVSTGSPSPNFMDNSNLMNNFIFFNASSLDDVKKYLGSSTNAPFEMNYPENNLDKSRKIYFKFFVDIDGSLDYEYVPGYTKVASSGFNGQYGFIELEPVKTSDNIQIPMMPITLPSVGMSISPICKSALQFARLNTPYKIWGECLPSDNIIKCLKKTLGVDLFSLLNGGDINKAMIKKDYCKSFKPEKSFIRLFNPDKQKLGGGSRVKSITINDGWNSISTGNDFNTGQEYSYHDGEKSTGVASYEPMIGNDENPLRRPNFYTVENALFPDDHHYQEGPFGESHFPAPIVGYSSVKVSNIKSPDLGSESLTRNATGHIEYGFYTSYDFPTIAKKSGLDKISIKSPNDIWKALSSSRKKTKVVLNKMGVSQGYLVMRNDMHGKFKYKKIYQEGGSSPINSYEVFYKKHSTKKILDNSVKVIHKDGTTSTKVLGKEIELMADTRKAENSIEVKIPFRSKKIPVIFIFGNIKWKTSEFETNSKSCFSSAVVTKVIDQYGLIDYVTYKDQGTITTVTNEAYDAETGNVLLTSVKNEFNDPIYSFQHPAHWVYDGMNQAYKKSNIEFEYATDISSGVITKTNAEKYFTLGDELAIYHGSDVTKVWVSEVSSNQIKCINSSGSLISITSPYKIKKLKTGETNQAGFTISSVSSLVDPTASGNIVFNAATEILNSIAIEYSDRWGMFCGGDVSGNNIGDIVNPFIKGIKGIWRVKKMYGYNTERTPDNTTTDTEIRNDGTYKDFLPFWDYSGTENSYVPIYNTNHPGNSGVGDYGNWVLNNEITKYNPYTGAALENKDVLGRYSSILYGYSPLQHNLPTAIASNAKYRQIAYDGFEDYDYLTGIGSTGKDHFSFLSTASTLAEITDEEHHTGKRSLKVKYIASETKAIETDCQSQVTFPVHTISNCDCNGKFSPEPGKYLISAWIKVPDAFPVKTYGTPGIRVNTTTSGTTPYQISVTGPIIEGWQKVEGTFVVEPSDTEIKVSLVLPMTDYLCPVYFDDLRIHPYMSSMQSIVYDPLKSRVSAYLDENNYATFLEYNQEGDMVRMKVETPLGIKTISETRSGNKKQ